MELFPGPQELWVDFLSFILEIPRVTNKISRPHTP
jgi:hypothetical protein